MKVIWSWRFELKRSLKLEKVFLAPSAINAAPYFGRRFSENVHGSCKMMTARKECNAFCLKGIFGINAFNDALFVTKKQGKTIY